MPQADGAKKILLVDDDVIILRVTKKILSDANYDVETVESGNDAVDFLKRNPVDLILLDLEMPGMTGFLTLSSIKRDIPENTAPIVFYTSHEEQEFIDRAYDLGCAGYVAKPIEKEGLLTVVRTFLGE